MKILKYCFLFLMVSLIQSDVLADDSNGAHEKKLVDKNKIGLIHGFEAAKINVEKVSQHQINYLNFKLNVCNPFYGSARSFAENAYKTTSRSMYSAYKGTKAFAQSTYNAVTAIAVTFICIGLL